MEEPPSPCWPRSVLCSPGPIGLSGHAAGSWPPSGHQDSQVLLCRAPLQQLSPDCGCSSPAVGFYTWPRWTPSGSSHPSSQVRSPWAWAPVRRFCSAVCFLGTPFWTSNQAVPTDGSSVLSTSAGRPRLLLLLLLLFLSLLCSWRLERGAQTLRAICAHLLGTSISTDASQSPEWPIMQISSHQSTSLW